MGDVAAPARVEIVDAKHLVAFGEQSFAQMRSEKSGATRDQNALRTGEFRNHR